jgi:PAS domain S-box-containing protein
MNAHTLRILILEDEPTDAQLMVHELTQWGFQFDWQRAETEEQFLAGLSPLPDVILAAYKLSHYSAPCALAAVQKRGLDVPFLVVAGAIGEEAAVAIVKQGAADYVCKDQLARLGPALRNALELKRLREVGPGAAPGASALLRNALELKRLREEKRKTEQLLRHSETWFQALVNHCYDGISVVDAQGIIRYTNPALLHILGRSPEELVGQHMFTAVHPDDVAVTQAAFADLLRHAGKTVHQLIRSRHADGSWRWLETTATSHIGEPPINGIVVNFRDVTERKTAEDRLRLQAAALEAASYGLIITDREGIIQYVNPAFTAMTGFSAAEALGQTPRICKSGKHGPETYRRLWETILAGQVWRGELINARKDGSLYTEVQTITPVRDEHGAITHFIGIKQDITERKALEAQFLQAQKMEAFGQLAGGVAHDFNNLLTVIGGCTDLLLQGEVKPEMRREILSQIKKASDRAAGLTNQLLAFSRRQVLLPQVVDLNVLVAEQEKMLRRLIGEDVQLVVQYDPDLHRIRADPGQLQQVILNLAINARDAMPRGGQLTIATRNVTLDDAFVTSHPQVRPGGYVLLEVRDTGCGMTPEVQARIFEPFFTTKEAGKGAGLGLATVLGIVGQSGGVIDVESQLGKGTSFRIYLPQTSLSASAVRSKPSAASLPRGEETILLVEDDDNVRSLIAMILQDHGYTVLQAPDGLAALEIVRAHRQPIDLLLTDVVMPRISGPKLASLICVGQRPMKVLYMSGYLDDAITRYGLLEDSLHIMRKPLSPDGLLAKVREVLDLPATDGVPEC